MRIVYGRPGPGRLLAAALVAIVLAGATLLAGASTPAAACTCVQLDLASLAKQYDAVFVATPVSVDEEDGQRVYEVRVSDVYKGSPGSTTTVTTAASDATCGIELDMDEQYMILGKAAKNGGDVETNTCSGTRPVSDRTIGEVEKALGPAIPYRGAPDDSEEKTDGPGGDDDHSGGDADNGTPDNGDAEGSDGDTTDDTASDAAGSDDGVDTSYVLIGGVLALAVGASFLLPRLRRRNRAGS